ncbi:MAG TPA: hypothetical protein VNX25_05510, partial [Verrucomicrobiae bacterium]|nr:hypothetical protein [Verrucomicrobiae bacterium]
MASGIEKTRKAAMVAAAAAVTVAAAAAVLALVAGAGSRLGLWHFRSGFSLLRAAGWTAAGSLPLGAAGCLLGFKSRSWAAASLTGIAMVLGIVTLA